MRRVVISYICVLCVLPARQPTLHSMHNLHQPAGQGCAMGGGVAAWPARCALLMCCAMCSDSLRTLRSSGQWNQQQHARSEPLLAGTRTQPKYVSMINCLDPTWRPGSRIQLLHLLVCAWDLVCPAGPAYLKDFGLLGVAIALAMRRDATAAVSSVSATVTFD